MPQSRYYDNPNPTPTLPKCLAFGEGAFCMVETGGGDKIGVPWHYN